MTILHKAAIALLLASAVGGGFWYLLNDISAKAEQIGELEAEKRQLTQTLTESEKEADAARQQVELWRDLYTDLQGSYAQIRDNREALAAQLNKLREAEDVQEYMACPMPDDLYDWVRQN